DAQGWSGESGRTHSACHYTLVGSPALKVWRTQPCSRKFRLTHPVNSKFRDGYFCAALHRAHLARFAALIRARPAAEMRRLGRIETTFWPRVRAQRAF